MSFKHAEDYLDRPDVVTNPGFHHGRHPEREQNYSAEAQDPRTALWLSTFFETALVSWVSAACLSA